jgi:hypothetical protein
VSRAAGSVAAATPTREAGEIWSVLIFGHCCGWSAGHSRAPAHVRSATVLKASRSFARQSAWDCIRARGTADVAAAGLRPSRAPLKCRDELRRELPRQSKRLLRVLLTTSSFWRARAFICASREYQTGTPCHRSSRRERDCVPRSGISRSSYADTGRLEKSGASWCWALLRLVRWTQPRSGARSERDCAESQSQLRKTKRVGLYSSAWHCGRCCGWSATQPRPAKVPRQTPV